MYQQRRLWSYAHNTRHQLQLLQQRQTAIILHLQGYIEDQSRQKNEVHDHSVGPPNTAGSVPLASKQSLERIAHEAKEVPSVHYDEDLSVLSPQGGHTLRDNICIRTTWCLRACERFCRCQCHATTHLNMPRTLAETVGRLFLSYTGTPALSRRSCNFPDCGQTGNTALRLHYYFPRWFILRALSVSGEWGAISGARASWAIRIPRPVGVESSIWRYVDTGNVSLIQHMFSTGAASPFDIGDNDGRTLLHVSAPAARFRGQCCNIAVGSVHRIVVRAVRYMLDLISSNMLKSSETATGYIPSLDLMC